MATISRPHTLARPLGSLEHFFYLLDQEHSVHFAMAAQIEGRTTLRAWQAALNALQKRHPLFSVCIEIEADETPHFRTVSETPIPIRVVEKSEPNWCLELAKELATPFDASQAPLVRAVLIRGEDETVFILTAHHSIADGLSLAFAVRDTLQALSGETLEDLPRLPAQELLLEAAREGSDPAECSQSAPPPPGRPITLQNANSSLPSVKALSLTPALTEKVIHRSRKEYTTVHGALCAALVLAGRENSDEWNHFPVRILSPFNLRKHLGVGDDCGVFIWSGITPIEPSSFAGFWDIARYAKSSLASKQPLGQVALEMATLGQAMRAGANPPTASQMLAQAFASELMLTNLGILSSYQFDYGNLKMKALWGPAALSGIEGGQVVGVTTVNGSLCLLHSSITPLPSLLDRAASILRSACET